MASQLKYWLFREVHARPKVVHEDGYATVVLSMSDAPQGGEAQPPDHVGQTSLTYESPLPCKACIAHDKDWRAEGVTARWFDGDLAAADASVTDLGTVYVVGEVAVRKASNAEGDQTTEWRVKVKVAVDGTRPLNAQAVALLSGNFNLALVESQGELPEVLQPKVRKGKHADSDAQPKLV